MTSRTLPPLLEPYLTVDKPQSQTLLTGILGANTNWLLLRYLYTMLKSQPHQQAAGARPQPQGQRRVGLRIPVAAEPELEIPTSSSSSPQESGDDESVGVLLVSFLRDFSFWKESAGRLGLDLEGLGRRGRLGFIDGLCVGGFGPGSDGESAAGGAGAVGGGLSMRRPPVPVAAGGVPGRGPPQQPAPAVTRGGGTVSQGQGQGPATGEKWKGSLPSLAVTDVSKTLHVALDELCQKNKKVVLVIDQLDFLLAATSAADGNGSSVSSALKDLLLDLREVSHLTGRWAKVYIWIRRGQRELMIHDIRNHMLRFSRCRPTTR